MSFTATEGTWISLDVSADGGTLAFELLGDIYTMSATGGPARALLDGPAWQSQPRYSRDGAWLAYVSDASGSDNAWIAPARGGTPRQLTHVRRALMLSPAWSADGRQLFATVIEGRTADLWRFDVATGEGEKLVPNGSGPPTPLVSAPAPGPYGAHASADGASLYYAAVTPRPYGSRQGASSRIVRRDLASGREEPVWLEEPIAMKPLTSPDGQWLVYGAQARGLTGLRLRHLRSAEERWLAFPVQRNELEARASRDVLPDYAFSPDSRSVFAAWGGRIHRLDVPGGRDVVVPFSANVSLELAPSPEVAHRVATGPVRARYIQQPTLARDGRLAFSTLGRIYVAAPGGPARRLTGTEHPREFMPAWSPDGQWIAFVTWGNEGGHLWKVRSAGGEPERLSDAPAYWIDPAWLPDGSGLVAVRAPTGSARSMPMAVVPPDAAVVRVPSGGGAPTTIAPAAGARHPHFGSDLQRVVLSAPTGLVSLSLGDGTRAEVARFGAMAPAGPVPPALEARLSPNGKSVAVLNGTRLSRQGLPAAEGATPPTLGAGDVVTEAAPAGFAWDATGESLGWTAGAAFHRPGSPRQALDVQVPRLGGTGTLVLRGGRALTMRGSEVIPSADIVVTDDRITAIGPQGRVRIPAGARVVDITGKVVMPGIIDIHAHGTPRRDLLEPEASQWYANLAFGVTTMRDPQTSPEIFAYADLAEAGEMPSPRILSTGPGLFADTDFGSLDAVRATLTRYRDDYGTPYIKSYLVGNRQQRQWMAQASRELGMVTTTEGGADTKMNLTHAIDGFSGNEHAIPTTPVFQDVVQLYARSGITYTPTLLVAFGGAFPVFPLHLKERPYDHPRLRAFFPLSELFARTQTRLLAFPPEDFNATDIAAGATAIMRRGGNVGLGGHGEMQGLQVHWEMRLLVEGGMRPHEALRVATVNGAKALGLSQDLGTLEVGKLADLLVLDRDPLTDIRHSESVSRVMRAGVMYDAATLDRTWPSAARLPGPWWRAAESNEIMHDTAYDVLLTGGTVVDGTGAPRRVADVAIRAGRIVAVGRGLAASKAAQVVDVRGLVVAPGFIDNHAHLVTLEQHPAAENFVRQGITTIMASLHSQEQPWPMDAYRARVRMAPNVGLFAGHTWIRKRVMGLDNRAPTPVELAHMEALVDSSMRQGALGLATGLEYVPATYAAPDEVIALARVAARHGGRYVTHMRDEGPRLLESVEETLRLGREAGLPVLINHHKVTGAAQFGATARSLALIDKAIVAGQRVAHDAYPYTAFSTYSDLMFPSWALAGGPGEFARRVADTVTRARLVQEMVRLFPEQAGRGPESIQLREVASDASLQGRTLADYLTDRRRGVTVPDAVEALIELQLAGGFIGIFHAMDDADVTRVIRHPASMFETDGDLVETGQGFPHPRSHGSFPRVLGTYVRERGVLTLEEAVRKMTSMPADWWGQPDRGRLRPGARADVVVFDAATIGDRATYTNPHRSPAGVVDVLVNGRFVLRDGTMTSERPGMFLERRSAPASGPDTRSRRPRRAPRQSLGAD